MRLNTYIDGGKNFIKFIDAKGNEVQLMRWGWFEDNIISKYSALVGNDGELAVTFRSIKYELGDDGNPIPYTDSSGNETFKKSSVLIGDHKLLRAANPSHSLIFKTDYKSSSGGSSKSAKLEKMLDDLNREMISGKITRQFNHPQRTATDDREGFGFLRNIFINVKVIQKHFGVDIENLGPSTGGTGYHTDGVAPRTNIVDAMLDLMGEVSANFYSYWRFAVVNDIENDTNSMLIDELASPSKDFAYSTFMSGTDYGNPSSLTHLGVYQFPSMEYNSVVKSQTFDVKIPNGDGMALLFAVNSSGTEPSGDLDVRGFQFLGDVQSSTIDTGLEKNIFSNIRRLYTKDPKAGFPYGSEAVNMKLQSDFDHRAKVKDLAETLNENSKADPVSGAVYWRKYAPAPTAPLGTPSSEASTADNRGIIFKDGRYHFVQEGPKDDANSISIGDVGDAVSDAVSGAASNALSSAGISIGDDGGSENEVTVGDGDQALPMNQLSFQPTLREFDYTIGLNTSLDDNADNSFFTSDNQQYIAGNYQTALQANLQGNDDAPEVNQEDLEVAAIESGAQPSPPTPKVATVTAQTEDIGSLYYLVNDKTFDPNADHIIERLRLKASVIKYNTTLIKSSGKKGTNNLPTIPGITMSLTIDGIGGLIPGNQFNVTYAPAQYVKSFVKDGINYGPLIYFQIQNLKQEITVDGWNTTFDGQYAPNRDAREAYATALAEEVDGYFNLEISRAFGVENTPFGFLGKIKEFIGVVSEVADSVSNFFSDALSYQEEVNTAKKLAEAENEDKSKKMNTADGDVVDASEQSGTFWERVGGVASTVVAGPATVVSGAATGVGRIAGDAGGRILDFLSGNDFVPLEGDINPEGGDKSNVSQQLEIDDTKTSDKHPSLIKLEVSDKMGSPDETIKPSLGARIRDTLKSAKSRIRKERVAKVTPKPTARSKELLKKIQFTHDDSGIIQSEGSEDITVTVVSKGVYNNEERTAEQTYLGVADQQEELIKDAINDNETAIAAVFAEAFPDDSVAGTPAPEKTNPGYPFSEPYYSEEPFGSYANRADARAALAAAFGYSEGYTAYKNNFDTQQRKDHWDSSPDLW
jgi:hypothetical protein